MFKKQIASNEKIKERLAPYATLGRNQKKNVTVANLIEDYGVGMDTQDQTRQSRRMSETSAESVKSRGDQFQHEKELKAQLLQKLRQIDRLGSKMVKITVFQQEAENLGIDLDEKIYLHILMVYKRDKFDRNSQEINYELVLKSLVPTLQKDQKNNQSGKKDFRVRWSMQPISKMGIQNDRQEAHKLTMRKFSESKMTGTSQLSKTQTFQSKRLRSADPGYEIAQKKKSSAQSNVSHSQKSYYSSSTKKSHGIRSRSSASNIQVDNKTEMSEQENPSIMKDKFHTLQMLQQRPIRKLFQDEQITANLLKQDFDIQKAQCTHPMNDLEFVQKNMQKIKFDPQIDKKLNKIVTDFEPGSHIIEKKIELLGSELNPNQRQRFNKDSYDAIKQKVQHAKGNCVQISSASTAINVYKNMQTEKIIKMVSKSDFTKYQQQQIKECIRQFNIDLPFLLLIKQSFMSCDEDQDGFITKKDLIEKLYEQKVKLPRAVLNFILNVLSEEDTIDSDQKPGKRLSLVKLQSLLQLYYRCPMHTGDSTNNSEKFKTAITMKGYEDIPISSNLVQSQKNSVQQIFRQIHIRIEQKFKDYRRAFRSFDLNFDGSITFQEFETGCVFSGINIPIDDLKTVFSIIDYDNTKEVDFKKFCLINTDKSNDIARLIKDIKQEDESHGNTEKLKLLEEKHFQLKTIRDQIHPKKYSLLQKHLEQEMAKFGGRKKSYIHKDHHKYVTKQLEKKPAPYASEKCLQTDDNKIEAPKPKNNDINKFQQDVQQNFPSIMRKHQQEQLDAILIKGIQEQIVSTKNDWKPRDYSKGYMKGLRKYEGASSHASGYRSSNTTTVNNSRQSHIKKKLFDVPKVERQPKQQIQQKYNNYNDDLRIESTKTSDKASVYSAKQSPTTNQEKMAKTRRFLSKSKSGNLQRAIEEYLLPSRNNQGISESSTKHTISQSKRVMELLRKNSSNKNLKRANI